MLFGTTKGQRVCKCNIFFGFICYFLGLKEWIETESNKPSLATACICLIKARFLYSKFSKYYQATEESERGSYESRGQRNDGWEREYSGEKFACIVFVCLSIVWLHLCPLLEGLLTNETHYYLLSDYSWISAEKCSCFALASHKERFCRSEKCFRKSRSFLRIIIIVTLSCLRRKCHQAWHMLKSYFSEKAYYWKLLAEPKTKINNCWWGPFCTMSELINFQH